MMIINGIFEMSVEYISFVPNAVYPIQILQSPLLSTLCL